MPDTSSLQQNAEEQPTIQDVRPRDHSTQLCRPNPRFYRIASLRADMTSIGVSYTFWTGLKTLYLLLKLHVLPPLIFLLSWFMFKVVGRRCFAVPCMSAGNSSNNFLM